MSTQRLGGVSPKDANFSPREKSAPGPRFALLSANREEPCPLRCGGLSERLPLASLNTEKEQSIPGVLQDGFVANSPSPWSIWVCPLRCGGLSEGLRPFPETPTVFWPLLIR